MDTRTPEIRSVVLEPWAALDQKIREPDSVKAVPKDEGASFQKLRKERDAKKNDKYASLNGRKVKELTEEIQRSLLDLSVDLSFEVYIKTGELVVTVVNRASKKVIRQIPPEDLVKLHGQLEELRGVLFAGKA